MSVFNIVWADDEIDDFLDEEYENDLENQGFKVVGKARNGEELQVCLENPSFIDAVIVDANFNERSSSVGSERDISGLAYARSLYNLTLNRSIPFFLYTNRTEEVLREITRDNPSFLDDFPRHEKWFSKHAQEERDEMLEAIKNEVERRNTPEFQIRNRYAQVFLVAESIEGAQELLLRGLTNTDNVNDVQDFFNPARKIIEKIFGKLKKQERLPPLDTLNKMSKFLSYGFYEDEECKYRQTAVIMHPALAHSLKFYLDVTQDGSHGDGNLNLQIDNYARDYPNTYLFKPIFFIAMELLLWYKGMTQTSSKEWEGNKKFIYIGKLYKSFHGGWYTNEYRIENDSSLYEGAKIGIKKAVTNKNTKDSYKKYVYRYDYEILD